MIRNNIFGLIPINTNAIKFKYIILGIMAIVTLITINAYGTVFAADSVNSINPDFQSDPPQSSSSDTTGAQDQQSQSSSSDTST